MQGKVCPEHKVGKQGYLVVCTVNEDTNIIISLGCEDCAASSGKNIILYDSRLYTLAFSVTLI